MQVHFGLDGLLADWASSIACIGVFDGVHLGHQAVIREAVSWSESIGSPAVLITFDRHPLAVLAPERCPQAVGTVRANLSEFERLGVSICVVLSFNEELRQTSAEDFLRTCLIEGLRAKGAVVGQDFAFGRGREGTAEWLSSRIDTRVVPPLLLDGARVSSTAIRLAIGEGRVEDAARLLGRPFAFEGIVVEGEKVGRQLGFPTANLARSSDQVVPADGVYAGSCATPFGEFRAAISVGVRPTFDGRSRTIEAHLIDYPGTNLYGKPVVFRLESRLRAQERFDDGERLAEQMKLDAEAARG